MKSLKNIFAGTKLRMILRSYQSSVISLPDDLHHCSNVLVCLPSEQRELTMIKSLLPEISRIFSESEIYLMAAPNSTIYDIFPRKGYRIMTPTSQHLTWSGLASRGYLKQLRETNYNLILDLNLTPNSFARSILLAFPEAVKIGRSNVLGTPYYNIEIKTKFIRDAKNIYRSMVETIDKLKNPASNNINEPAN